MIQTLNGHKFDKQHTWTVDLFTDFDKYANYPDEWEEPAVRPFKEHVSFFESRFLSPFSIE